MRERDQAVSNRIYLFTDRIVRAQNATAAAEKVWSKTQTQSNIAYISCEISTYSWIEFKYGLYLRFAFQLKYIIFSFPLFLVPAFLSKNYKMCDEKSSVLGCCATSALKKRALSFYPPVSHFKAAAAASSSLFSLLFFAPMMMRASKDVCLQTLPKKFRWLFSVVQLAYFYYTMSYGLKMGNECVLFWNWNV